MDQIEAKKQLDRLLAEATKIAPSIINFDRDSGNYGRVSDEELNWSEASRWQIEARATLRELSHLYGPMFVELFNKYNADIGLGGHSESIRIHRGVLNLRSAVKLLGSPLVVRSVTAPNRRRDGSMKIFVSWSGATSEQAANALRDCIGVVLPYATAWVSSEDIPKGARWSAELATALEGMSLGIFCLTPDNKESPWMHFEAGALSKSVAAAQIHPFLLGVAPGELSGPMSQFQATRFEREEVSKLLHAINNAAGSQRISSEQLNRAFNVAWTHLETHLRPLTDTLRAVSTASTATGEAVPGFDEISEDELKVLEFLEEHGGTSILAQIAAVLGYSDQRAQYVLDQLNARDMISATISLSGRPTKWHLTAEGRAALAKRGLLK